MWSRKSSAAASPYLFCAPPPAPAGKAPNPRVREEYIEIEPEHSTCQLTRKADEFVKSRATLLMKLPKEEEKEKPNQAFKKW